MTLAEIGQNLCRLPTAGRLKAWVGLWPGQNGNASRRKSSHLRKGASWLKTTVVQCAWAASHKTNNCYRTQLNRLCSKCGPRPAIAAFMLTAIHHMLKICSAWKQKTFLYRKICSPEIN